MSEIVEKSPIEQAKIPQKEQGAKPVEIQGGSEKISPLKKASRLIRLALGLSKPSSAADEFLIARTEESHEAEVEKPLRLQARGNAEVMKILRGEEDKGDRKIAIVAQGGGQAGAIGAGVLLGLRDSGALRNVDGFFGFSAGVPNIAFVATEQGDKAASIYWEENCYGSKFVNLPEKPLDKLKALKEAYTEGPDKPIIDTAYVEKTVREGKTPLDVDALRKSTKEVYASVMNVETGEMEWRDLRKEKDPVKVIGASICVPGVSSVSAVEIDGKKYVDGAFATEPMLKKVFEMGYTDVLILANDQFGKTDQPELVNIALAAIGKNGYGYNEKICRSIRNHRKDAKNAAYEVWDKIVKEDPKERVAIIDLAPDSLRVGNLETKSAKIKGAFEKARENVKGMFDRNIPLGSRPVEQQSASVELGAIAMADGSDKKIGGQLVSKEAAKEVVDNAGKLPESKMEGEVLKLGVETTPGNSGAGAKKVETIIDEKPTESEQEGVSKREKSVSKQIDEETSKLDSYFYGENSIKLAEISDKTANKARKEWGDMSEYKVKALKSINAQLEKYVPEGIINNKLDPSLDPSEQRIPTWMLRISEDGNGVYDPFYKVPRIKGLLSWLDHKVTLVDGRWDAYKKYGDGPIPEPNKEVVKKLQDAFVKAKAAEEKKPA